MIILLIEIIIAYILSVMLHEIAHSETAHYLGDNTARRIRRSSLNPFKHFRLSGPRDVPIKLHTDKQYIIVGLAGVVANIVLVLISLFLISVRYFTFLEIMIWMNIFLIVVNIIPVRCLKNDGYMVYKHLIHK